MNPGNCLGSGARCRKWAACPPGEPAFDYICDDLEHPYSDGCCELLRKKGKEKTTCKWW